MKMFIQTYFSFLICMLLYLTSLENAFCYAGEGDYLNNNVPLFDGNKELIAQENHVLDKPNNNGISIKDSSFNVLNFGAKGDGNTDDSQAFLKTWNATCANNGGLMYVPSPFTFLLQPLTFEGENCQPNIVVQVDGNVVAPEKNQWQSVQFQWILFNGLNRGLTIKGNGIFDGRGQPWWNSSGTHPHALRVAKSTNVTVTGIKIQNSPRMHIYFDSSQHIKVFGLTVLSPDNSRNTDGIHVSRVQDAEIYNNTVACGDDCISIQRGCSSIIIHDMICGPSHGISIGGLGPPGENQSIGFANVSSVNVYNSIISNSETGVRIKTWEDGNGNVDNVTYTNIQMNDVQVPIWINQKYCDNCAAQITPINSVQLNGVTYKGIRGTYTEIPVWLLCSEAKPCTNIGFGEINLVPSAPNTTSPPFCNNVYGQLLTNTTPPLNDCVKGG